MLLKQCKVVIEKNEYFVSFPTVGQLLDIESKKMLYSNDTYGNLMNAGTKTAMYTLDLIDALSTLMVLIPDLRKSLTVKSLGDLDAFTAKKLVTVYRKQFWPWYNELMKELYKEDEAEEEVDVDLNQIKEDEF